VEQRVDRGIHHAPVLRVCVKVAALHPPRAPRAAPRGEVGAVHQLLGTLSAQVAVHVAVAEGLAAALVGADNRAVLAALVVVVDQQAGEVLPAVGASLASVGAALKVGSHGVTRGAHVALL